MSLYHPRFEKDNCGFGLIAHVDGRASHHLLQTAIKSLARMTHRGAVAADGKTGDGCGLLLKRPGTMLAAIADACDFPLRSRYAVGNVFLSTDAEKAAIAKATLSNELNRQEVNVVGWRELPVNESVLGEQAKASLPRIEQIFTDTALSDADAFERRLYIARRRAEQKIRHDDSVFYVSSLSSRTILYKALVMPSALDTFYPDLSDPRLQTSLCVFHQRFSTNTLPQWRLAQPFRCLAHNGEINTIQGNRNWANARSYKFKTPWIPNFDDVRPLLAHDDSDSASVDNMLEVLLMGGMDIFLATQMMIPPAWQNVDSIDPDLRAFYEYYSMHMEPWDGPAGIVMTDGRFAACTLDRNGLRPARYVVTKDRLITLASEIGVHDYTPADVVAKGRLKPGQMMAVDTEEHQLLLPQDIRQRLINRAPYKQWLKQERRNVAIPSSEDVEPAVLAPAALSVYQKLFQVTFEERDQIIRVLAEGGQEAVGSMGDDTPLPVLSRQIRPLYDYFRQDFAQVTNPPIDSLRERIVMSLETEIGRERNLFDESPSYAKRLTLDSPVLSSARFDALTAVPDEDYASHFIDLHYSKDINLDQAVKQICVSAEKAVLQGKVILVLTDREISKDRIPVHALLATGAVHHHLVKSGLRCDANIIVATATARDPHHFAALIGYGATAIYPYLAYQCIQDMVRGGATAKRKSAPRLIQSYRKAINKGLYKIASKMGISAISSYRGAQLFEIIGLDQSVVELCFTNSVNRIGGATFAQLDAEQRQLHTLAWDYRQPIKQGGVLKYMHGGEYHAYHPDVVHALHTAVTTGSYEDYLQYADLVNSRPVTVLRDLFILRAVSAPISVDEVEPVEAITPRFDSAAMSLGALSPEAHEVLAQAMNNIGGRSNSGEGGEDINRFGTVRTSKIKQVASGRFGVTPHYLVNAEVLQIKIAQGAKPGEGGQLPGHKVNDMIAQLRYSSPGVALISPPPHHDIYSIEDLAQLIFDLKQVNPKALVSVKLVAKAGVGTIAAGVAKAYADLITISGYDGGTGASPYTSIKYAGGPWELGLAETHQTLRVNDLRDKIRLQTDGGLKTGVDVVKAAILGAESFGFGTAPMIAMGCKYLRICHLNNCATGVATQDEMLRRKHFVGTVERVTNFFRFVAQETREQMALLGVRTVEDLIGATHLLETKPGETEKQSNLDLSPILSNVGVEKSKPQFCTWARNKPFDRGELAEKMVADTLPAIEASAGGSFEYQILNTNRSIGARISGEIARRHGNLGMEGAPLTVKMTGTAGQSFGVWNAGGLYLILEGDANDYAGKGMAGGKIVIYPPTGSTFDTRTTTIVGNTCLYGATGGRFYAAGVAGERFAVRNSGAYAIVEGIGDHGCEYMTGGVVCVLGATGLNFGAGMTGGMAYVLDQDRLFQDRCNRNLIDMHRLTPEHMEAHLNYLHEMVQDYASETGSSWGREISSNFEDFIQHFWLVTPRAANLESLLSTLLQAA